MGKTVNRVMGVMGLSSPDVDERATPRGTPSGRRATGGWILGAALLMGTMGWGHPLSGQDLLWSFETAGPLFSSPTLHGEAAYVGSGDGNLYAVELATGSEIWRFPTGSPVDATPAVADGMVFVLSRSGTLHAVDAAEGRERWSYRTGGETRLDFWDFYLSDPLVHRGMVVFGSGDGAVYALDRASGDLRWSFETEAPVHGAAVADGDHVYVGGFDGVLYALKAESGEVSWTFQARGNEFFPRGEFQRGPALHDGVLYVGSRDYRLYAIRAEDGEPLWEKQEGDGWIIATPLVARDRLYFGASDGQRFYALDRGTGEVGWSTPVQTRVFGSAVEGGGSVIFGGFNGKLLAVDPSSGEVRWTFQTPASLRNFHRVYDETGQLNDEMRELYRSGKGLEAEERILTLGSIPGTPAVRGNTVYFGTTEGILHAVEVSSGS